MNSQQQKTCQELMNQAIQSAKISNFNRKKIRDIAEDLQLNGDQKKEVLLREITKSLLKNAVSGIKTACYDNCLQKHPEIKEVLRIFTEKARVLLRADQQPNRPYYQAPVNLNPFPFPYYHQPFTHPQFQFMLNPQSSYFNQLPLLSTNPYQNQQVPQQQIPQPTDYCICKNKAPSNNPRDLLKCVNLNCQKEFHCNCLKIHYGSALAKNFECPYCVLKHQDPLHDVIQIISTQKVQSQNYSQKHVNFNLTDEQYSQIHSKTIHLEIRCIKMDPAYMCEITWPDYGELELNGVKVLEFKPLQQNSSLKKRKDEKYTVKDANLLTSGPNQVLLKEFPATPEMKDQFRIGESSFYFFGIYLIQKLTKESLIENIRQTSTISEAQSRKNIVQYFADNNTHDVHIDQQNISLICNFSLSLIQTPAKGKYCQHLQCFSLENFVLMMESTSPRKWKCPICKTKCYELIVDEYFLKIIEQINVLNKNCAEVIIKKNADYMDVEVKQPESNAKNSDSEAESPKASKRVQPDAPKEKCLETSQPNSESVATNNPQLSTSPSHEAQEVTPLREKDKPFSNLVLGKRRKVLVQPLSDQTQIIIVDEEDKIVNEEKTQTKTMANEPQIPLKRTNTEKSDQNDSIERYETKEKLDKFNKFEPSVLPISQQFPNIQNAHPSISLSRTSNLASKESAEPLKGNLSNPICIDD